MPLSVVPPHRPPVPPVRSARLWRRGLRSVACSLVVLAALTLATGLPAPRPASAAGVADTAVSRVEITGNRTIDSDTIRAHLAVAPGARWDEASADRAIRALYATGTFSDVRIERRGGVLAVIVAENPIVGQVSFTGNAEVEKKKLEELAAVKPRMRYTAAKGRADVRAIRDHYRSLGRVETTVTARVVPQPSGTVEVVYAIAEGKVARIDAIEFRGNHAFTGSQLRDVVTTSESSWLDVLKTAAFYDAQRLETDAELVRRYYQDHGFPDARVRPPEATLNAERTGYRIVFTLEEGQRYAFAPPRIENALPSGARQPLDLAAVAAALTVKPDNPYDRGAIGTSIEAATGVLSKQGHVFARVRPIETRDARRITVTFRLEPAPALFVERIEITGNGKTKDHVIRRELRLAEGDPVNAHRIEQARARVQRLGFFKTVTLKPKPGSAADRAVLHLDVVEDQTIEAGVGIGYSTAEGVVGDISIADRNLFGNGQSLRLKLSGSFSRLQADVGFTEPHLLGTNLAGGFDLFYKDQDLTQYASYKSVRVGGTVRLAYPLSDTFTGGVNYTFVRSTLYDVGSTASAAIKEAAGGGASNTYNTSSVGYSATWDTRDRKRNATSGVYFSLSQDLAGVGGDVRYVRSGLDGRAYYAVSQEVTAMGRVQGGIIGGWGGQDVRLLDLYTKGNDLVRGFAPAGIGPRDTASANLDTLGGRMFFGTTGELQFQVPGVPKEVGLRGAVFFDAGSLWGVNKTAASLPGLAGGTPALRASVGTGLAWDSPIGALRVDYAVPVLKQSYDKTQPLSFGLSPF